MNDKVKVALVILVVIVINVVLWKLGVPTKWEITKSIFGY